MNPPAIPQPKGKPGRPRGRGSMLITISLSLDLKQIIDEKAEDARTTRSGWVQMAIMNELQRDAHRRTGVPLPEKLAADLPQAAPAFNNPFDTMPIKSESDLEPSIPLTGSVSAQGHNPFDAHVDWKIKVPQSPVQWGQDWNHGAMFKPIIHGVGSFVSQPGYNPFAEIG